jgi:hypothetical protein
VLACGAGSPVCRGEEAVGELAHQKSMAMLVEMVRDLADREGALPNPRIRAQAPPKPGPSTGPSTDTCRPCLNGPAHVTAAMAPDLGRVRQVRSWPRQRPG